MSDACNYPKCKCPFDMGADNKCAKGLPNESSRSPAGYVCECSSMAGYGPDSWGKHHHVNCPKYSTEKHPYLLYYEEVIDAWTFAPEKVENLIAVADQLDDGDDMELMFKRKDMTDAEIAAIPAD